MNRKQIQLIDESGDWLNRRSEAIKAEGFTRKILWPAQRAWIKATGWRCSK
jgi:hypothetical protein